MSNKYKTILFYCFLILIIWVAVDFFNRKYDRITKIEDYGYFFHDTGSIVKMLQFHPEGVDVSDSEIILQPSIRDIDFLYPYITIFQQITERKDCFNRQSVRFVKNEYSYYIIDVRSHNIEKFSSYSDFNSRAVHLNIKDEQLLRPILEYRIDGKLLHPTSCEPTKGTMKGFEADSV